MQGEIVERALYIVCPTCKKKYLAILDADSEESLGWRESCSRCVDAYYNRYDIDGLKVSLEAILKEKGEIVYQDLFYEWAKQGFKLPNTLHDLFELVHRIRLKMKEEAIQEIKEKE